MVRLSRGNASPFFLKALNFIQNNIKPLKTSPEKLKKLNEGPFGPSPPFLIISSLEKVQINSNDYVYGRFFSHL